jgi:hypothetical protein
MVVSIATMDNLMLLASLQLSLPLTLQTWQCFTSLLLQKFLSIVQPYMVVGVFVTV